MTISIQSFERQIRSDHQTEHALLLDAQGRVIAQRDGDKNSVAFTEQELNQACLGLLTHSHPLALPPSGEDLTLAARYGLTLRAVGVTDDGSSVDYTVRMPVPSQQMAERIAQQFDQEVIRAEQELVSTPINDRTWQRASRNLAVERLAKQYGFRYEHTESLSPIGEMDHSPEVQRLDALANVDSVMRSEVFDPLIANLIRLLTQNANANGVIPFARLSNIQHGIFRVVVRSMLGKPHQDGTLQPYTVHQDKVLPHSDYFAAVFGLMRNAAGLAVDHHAEIMRRYLPEDLRRLYESATLTPFIDTSTDGGETSSLFYDPLHLWIGKDGKRLSDRIWQSTGDMRTRLDAYLTGSIARSVPVADMVSGLEEFLVNGTGSYEAMRLARTETSAAYYRADSAAARLNPFVESYRFFTAPSHQCCDVCDLVESGSPYPKTDTIHLPPQHPQCICGITWNEVSNPQKVIIALRQQIEQAINGARKAISDVVGPLSKRFIDLLFRGTRS